MSDRYGGLYPDPWLVCKGQCEGMGVYPVYNAGSISYADLMRKDFVRPTHIDNSPAEMEAWHQAHEAAGEHQCDGYHFIKCQDGHGTGKAGAP